MQSFNRRSFLSGLLLWVVGPAFAQVQAVPKTVLVEHFTNTRCSVCSSRNPGFYANLRQQPASTLHLAYYPSSPYRTCVFSQQNPLENDARTNFYGIYGSTPRLVLNGTVIPAGQNYAAPTLFTPYAGQTSPLAVLVALTQAGSDSLTVTVQVQTITPAPLTGLTLYVALAEDTVFYAAPNGENLHLDVFRKSFTGPVALPITPAVAGGDLVIRRTVAIRNEWVLRRLYAIALVQQPSGILVQAGASPLLNSAPLGAADNVAQALPVAFPNPVRETLRFSAPVGAAWQVINTLGQVVAEGLVAPADLDVRTWPRGTYLLKIAGKATRRIVKE